MMKHGDQLKGTFFLVMVLGLLIILSWWSIFELYLRR